MAQLPGADLQSAIEFVAEVHAFEDEDAFRRGILPGLERLIPCDLSGYNEVDPGGGALVLTHPEPMHDLMGAEIARLAHQHPLISVQMNGDGRAYRISDFLSAREFHALELYAEIYGRIGAEDQLAIGLPGESVIGIAFNRARRSFSERDRAMLDLLRPHLAQAHARIIERRHTAALLEALEQGVATGAVGVVLLGDDGAVQYAGDRALTLLDLYFSARPGTGLPAEIEAWLGSTSRGGEPGTPLIVTGTPGQLSVRAEPGKHGGTVLLLAERPALTAERLAPLGLTGRQAEVLALLAAGYGVARIADALFVSPATVRKHLEHVYARLGVHSRAEAVARALTVA